jgi:hypothetical protein
MEAGVGVTRIIVHYTDGRMMTFVPDAGREAFSEDDVLELKNILDRAASTAEWADLNTRLGF